MAVCVCATLTNKKVTNAMETDVPPCQNLDAAWHSYVFAGDWFSTCDSIHHVHVLE